MSRNIGSAGVKPTALLSGAYQAGLGSSIRLGLQAAGWHVIALYDPGDTLQVAVSKKDTESRKIAIDLTDPQAIAAMAASLPARLDAFVHAAMFFEMDAGFSQRVWASTLQVNVIAAAQIVELLRNRLRGGSVVAISSTEAFMGSFGSPAYSASRAAMHNLVQSWANKLGPDAIRANAIAAGWIGGVMDTDEVFNQSRKITPLGRLGLPEEVAATVTFLCSKEASFINGSVVTVDGGYSGADSVAKFEYQEHLAATDFHRFTSEFMTGRAGEGDEIWAASILFPGEWEEDDPIKVDQLEAARRGAVVNRIFVVPPELKDSFNDDHPLVRLHHEHPNIHGYRIDYDDLMRRDPEVLLRLGDGWTALNEQVAILDDAGTAGSRGTLVTSPVKLAALRADFERLQDLALPL